MGADPMANNNYLAVPQTGEKTAHAASVYGFTGQNSNESCCGDTPGPSTPSIPGAPDKFCVQDMTGPH